MKAFGETPAPGPLDLGSVGPPIATTTVAGTRLFLTTESSESGATVTELWVSNGTAAGTTAIASSGGTIADPTAFDGKLAFIESTPDGTGTSLWLSDGTPSGTTQVFNFPTQSQSDPQTPTMAALDGKLFISAPPIPGPSVFGFSTLWESDGTAAGTTPIAGVPVSANVDYLAVDQGKLYFTVDTPRTQLWVTDGTAAGTKMVANIGTASAIIDDLVAAGPNLYITYNSNTLGPDFTGLYVSKGTTKGTIRIHRFANNVGIAVAGLPDGDLILNVDGTSSKLWVTNGTATGTTEVKGMQGGSSYSGLIPGTMTVLNGRVFFQAGDAKNGNGLWQSNGTVAGTSLVQEFNSGNAFSYPYALAGLNGNLIVAADDGTHGMELFSGPIPPPAGVTLSKRAR